MRSDAVSAKSFGINLEKFYKKTVEIIEKDNANEIENSNNKIFINLSNHPSADWSAEQKSAAVEQFGEIRDLSFPDVNPNGDEEYIQALAAEYVKEITNYELLNTDVSVHVMGEMTFTFAMVKALQQEGITCIASTTERVSIEESGVKTSEFRFVRFRNY
jgi:hypothetical protein